MSKTLRIAAIPGDGIGKEVLPEGLRVLEAAASRFGFELQVTHIEWASCDYYARTGAMMPDDWKAQLQGMDAIYFGAVGWPDSVPDHVSLWGSLLKFRRESAQAPDGGHQVQRHRDQHALVGRPRRRGGPGLPGDHGRQVAHRHPVGPLRAEAAALRRGGG